MGHRKEGRSLFPLSTKRTRRRTMRINQVLRRRRLHDDASQSYFTESARRNKEAPSPTPCSQDRQWEENVIALRTVPVVLVNGKNTIQVNALIDDGSIETYVKKAVVAELGIHVEMKSITVYVLISMAKTFSSMPVERELRSVDFTTSFHAMTKSHVTLHLRVIDWSDERKTGYT